MFTTRDEYLQAVARATRAASLYYNNTGTSPLSDQEYDRLLEAINRTGELHGWHEGDRLNEVSAGQLVTGDVPHRPPMLSLLKLKELDDVLAFIGKQRNDVVLEPKMDGIAIAARYAAGRLAQVSTRGDGQLGEDITAQLLTCNLHHLPREIAGVDVDFEVRGELYVDLKHFQELQAFRKQQGKAAFANHRNVITGVLRSFEDTSHVDLSFAAYDVYGAPFRQAAYRARMGALEPYGFRPAFKQKLLTDESKTLRQRIEEFGEMRNRLRTPTDGIVIKVNSMDAREELGNANAHPRWAVAYKYEAEITTTRFTGVIRKIGRTGRVTYRAKLVPVQLAGSRVSRATLNNADFIAAMDLRIGDTVMLRRANDIIPEILGVDTSQPRGAQRYVPETTCPTCGKSLDRSAVNWICHTPTCSKAAKLIYALSKPALDADNWNEGVVEAFYGTLVHELPDFYTLTEQQLANGIMISDNADDNGEFRMIRVGEKRAAKLHQSLLESKQRPLHRILTALAIPVLGPITARKITQAYREDIARILRASESDLGRLDGIGKTTAPSIWAGLHQSIPTLQALTDLGFAALQANTNAVKRPEPLAGHTFVITGGVTGWTKDQLADLIYSLGGNVSGSVSKQTSMLLYGGTASAKYNKAQQLGVPAVPLDDFIKQYGNNQGTV